MSKDSLGDRMKENYENRSRIKLIRRMPAIIRLDGKSFHTLTKTCHKPFDSYFINSMVNTALYICKNIQGAKCAYIQSDEISILLTDFDRLKTDAWFDYNIQKIVSVSAGMASACFSRIRNEDERLGIFDSRVFNMPKEEVCNYFVWRQQDWKRNSMQMLGQAYFSQKALQNKSIEDIKDMLEQMHIYWTALENNQMYGTFIFKQKFKDQSEDNWIVKDDVQFTENRDTVEQYLVAEEE